MIFDIVAVGILGVSASLILKEIKPSISIYVSMATCIVISFLVISKFKVLLEDVNSFLGKLSIPSNLIVSALKIIGVGYLIEFASDIAEEGGLISIANKITFAGKILVASICFPYVFDLFDMVLGLI